MHDIIVTKKSTLERQEEAGNLKRIRQLESLSGGFEEARDFQAASLKQIIDVYSRSGLEFKVIERDEVPEEDYKKARRVISAGGDGTALYISQFLPGGMELVGVNVDARPEGKGSVGFLCATTAQDFELWLPDYLNGKVHPVEVDRLEAVVQHLDGRDSYYRALNDVKIIGRGGAARYEMTYQGKKEKHMTSFSIVCSPIGFTGEMIQLGGEATEIGSKQMQYKAIGAEARDYRFKQMITAKREQLEFISHMEDGQLFIDGNNNVEDFEYGDKLTVRISGLPIKLVGFDLRRREEFIRYAKYLKQVHLS